MTVAKTPRQSPFDADPAVEAALGDSDDVYTRIARVRKMTPAQRRKAQRDQARNRVMLDLPATLETVLDAMAGDLSVPKSQAAAFLMILGLHSVAQGTVNPRDCRRPSRSMRYDYALNLPTIPAAFRQQAEQWLRELAKKVGGGVP